MPNVQMTRYQMLQFLMIILALPMQYMLVKWANNQTEDARLLSMTSVFSNIRSFMKDYFTISSWKNRMATYLGRPVKGKSRNLNLAAGRQGNMEGECVAKEVFLYRNQHGDFATSTEARSPRKSFVKYRVGQTIKHKKYGYKGVIVGWDESCRAPDSWIRTNHRGEERYRDSPHYAVLVDMRDRRGVQDTYVAEENIEIITNTKVRHPHLNDYFDFYDGAQYHMRPAMKVLYPHD
ncbi:unnamed protein product [Clavelina lepadiformis]|uniref:Hemimethylated DNA-binding domain-containing protein n=1 Tax=Clavelina lepadiformis TaxID=159417 RepID=A0ABP0FLZ3_CLALP